MCTKEFFGLKAQNVQFYFLSFHAERSRRMGGAGGTLNGNMEQAKRLKRNFLCNEMNGDDDEKKFSSQFFFVIVNTVEYAAIHNFPSFVWQNMKH